MIKSRVLVAGALLAAAGAANAGISVPLAITSDYDFRGISQTDGDPAIQGGLTWTADSGFYVGAWASNVDFGDANVEVDAFLGFAGGDATKSIGYDVGAVLYAYPGSSDAEEVVELYAGISKGMFSGKLWFSPDNYGSTSWYVEGNAAIPLGASKFSIPLHVGYSWGDYWSGAQYVDYSVGLSYAIKAFTLNVKWVDSDTDYPHRGKVIGTISTTLPWASE